MASDSQATKRDVFLSHSGRDTAANFTGHLHAALSRNCIDAAFTGGGDRGGRGFGNTLFDKISECQVSVVVFSQNYAESACCLEELVRIMECKDMTGQVVLPVFHGVEPTHVRKQSGPFGDGLNRLLQDPLLEGREETWRNVLVEIANLSGWDSMDKPEDKIVAEIVDRVERVLEQVSLEDQYDGFVGFSRVEKVESLLGMESLEKLCLVGIWGMGGIGKTTIARLLFYRLANRFDGACFVGNVTAKAEREGLDSVRKDMILQLLGVKNEIAGPYMLSPAICRKLRRRRLLVVLDDVNTPLQLKALVGRRDFYGQGSRIVVTSRDKQVLKNGCALLYEVEKLNMREALQLFKLHAFKEDQPSPEFIELSRKAATFAQGLPLALEVLACNLCGRNLEDWEIQLSNLEETPDLEVTDILRTSYDGLEDNEKSIYLDIACIFHGWKKDRVEAILDGCGFHAGIGLSRLSDKALINLSKGVLWMHDLLQQIGQDIVLLECIEEPGKRSRLWRLKEIAEVLTRNPETKRGSKVEAISLDLSLAPKNIELKSEVFENLPRLRILHFHYASAKNMKMVLPEGLQHLPEELRYLRWDLYPLPSLPLQFNPKNLVELRMVDNHLKQLWGEIEPCLPNLKYIDLSGSKHLTKLPNISNASKLETLVVSTSVNLKDISNLIQLPNLKNLSLLACTKITRLPPLPRGLVSLDLSYTKIKELPSSIEHLSQLEKLILSDCEELESLPCCIGKLKQLKELKLNGCPKLSNLPANLGDTRSLQTLITAGCPFNRLPPSINYLSSLETLNCSGYKGDALVSLTSLVSLKDLILQETNLRSLPEDIQHVTNLVSLALSNCKNLRFIPELPSSLCQLDAYNCTSLVKYTSRSLEDRHGYDLVPKFNGLHFSNCHNLEADTINEIFRDFWLRIRHILAPEAEKLNTNLSTLSSLLSSSNPELSAFLCFPGSEVPEWFQFSEAGSSLQVKTGSKTRLNPLRFVFCAVVAFAPDADPLQRAFTIKCDCQITESSKHFDSRCGYYFREEREEHVFVWCEHLGSSQFDFTGAMFKFRAVGFFSDEVSVDFVKIVKCGVTPIGRIFCDTDVTVVHDQDGSCPLLEDQERGNVLKRLRNHGRL